MNSLKTLPMLLAFSTLATPAWALSPVGRWTSIDDHTKKPRALMELWLEGDKLQGKVLELLAPDAKTISSPDCPGNKKSKPIVGMTVLWDLKKNGDEWNGGEILDPANGKTYSCILKMSEDGKRASVRGYIFNPMIGRTQSWLRAE